MSVRSQRAGLTAMVALLAAGWAADASADCLRRVYNRSSYVMVGRQDGAPPFTVMPGGSARIQISQPGSVDLAAYCAASPDGLGGAGSEVAHASFSYEAVLDRCFVKLGLDFFVPQLGRGFLGINNDTRPFAVNNPDQGDIVLGPFAAPSCPVLSRGY